MLPIFERLEDPDDILRHDCRHETACVIELDAAHPSARHAVCPARCPHFQVIPPVPAPSAPSSLARAADLLPGIPEFSREELNRLVSRGAGAKARKGGP